MTLRMKDLQPVNLPDMVRLGRWDDGGYVVPLSSIKKAEILYSFGVNDDVSFEAEVKDVNEDIGIVCVDPSVSTQILTYRALKLLVKGTLYGLKGSWAPAAREFRFPKRVAEFSAFFRRPNVRFIKKRLWYSSDEASVNIQELFSPDAIADRSVFVKMDIEGSEYRFIKQLYPFLDRITGIAVEFHDVDIHGDELARIVSSLKDKFYVAHVHGNNITGYVPATNIPMTLEVSFVSKRLYDAVPSPSEDDYPREGLDWPNHHAKPDMPISFSDA